MTKSITDRLVANVPNNEDKNWNLTVVEDETINAFVTPDGSIFVFTGLIDIVDNADELAAIIGHELSHVHLRHAVSKLSLTLLAGSALAICELYFLGDISRVSLLCSKLFVGLPMSRKHEIEADKCGIYFSGEAGFSPERAITVQEKLASLDREHEGLDLEKYLSTHPRGDERIASATEECKEFRKRTNEAEWLKTRKEKVEKIFRMFRQTKQIREKKLEQKQMEKRMAELKAAKEKQVSGEKRVNIAT